MRISKSKFVAGVQCLKRLYLAVHQPELAGERDESARRVIEQGRQVGLVAKKAFPGGVTVEASHKELDKALLETRELLNRNEAAAIFEATFEHEGVLVRTDVLKRSPSGFHLIEVKSATSVKPHYVYDVAIQKHVLTGAGVEVQQESLMHLNRGHVFEGGDYSVSDLFVTTDIKEEDAVSETEVVDRLREQFKILNRDKPPDIKPGRHCSNPVQCEFFDHCNPEIPAGHVSRLPRIGAKKVKKLISGGITSIKKITSTFALTERQRRAVDCVKTGKPFIGPRLKNEINSLKYPLCFMDFETLYPALPRFAKMAPYDHIPFQWSVHRLKRPGAALKHFEFLAEDNSDPRPRFMETLCEAVEEAKNIVVYNEIFEYSRLDDLARWLPKFAPTIERIKSKMWDLLVVVRQNVYHAAFAGSYSLKYVLPAFVPEMSYENLEIEEGTAAGIVWERFIDPATPTGEKNRLRKALFEYCAQDTFGMVRLLEELRKLA